jgi:hypothetical protein
MDILDFMVKHPSAFTAYSTLDPEGVKKAVEFRKARSEASVLGSTSPTATESKAGSAAAVKTATEEAGLTPNITQKKAQQEAVVNAARTAAGEAAKEPVKQQVGYSEKVGAVNNLNNSLDMLLSHYNKVPDIYKGFLGGKVGELPAAAMLQDPATRSAIQSYKSVRDKMSREIAKQLEGGRISDQDAVYYQKMMGSLQMYPEQAEAAVKAMKDYGQQQLRSYKQTYPNVKGNAVSSEEFSTEEEARAAGKKTGDRVKIGGVWSILTD